MTAIQADVADFLAPAVQRTRTPATPADRIQHDLPAGREVPLIEPGSDAWFTTISASKIAGITGRSAWDSPYRLHRVMKGQVEPEGIDDVKAAGHYHEPGIAAWFRDQHPDWTVRPCGTFIAAGNERHTAAPDRVIYKPDIGDHFDLLEIKTTRKPEQWGQPLTDQIPASYRDQVDWQMHCTGASRTHVAVEFPWFEYAEYIVDYDPERIAALVAAADEFLAGLDAGICPPPDDHPKTLEAQAEVYAEVDKAEGHDFDEHVVRAYVEAVAARKAAEAAEIGATTVIVEALAGRKDARHQGVVFAEWKSWTGKSKPKLYPKPVLPTFEPAPDQLALAEQALRSGDPADRLAWLNQFCAGMDEDEWFEAVADDDAALMEGLTAVPAVTDTEQPAPSERANPVQPMNQVMDTTTEPTRLAELLPEAVHQMRTDWLVARIRNIRDCGDPRGVDTLAKFWPTGAPYAPPWTVEQAAAIDELLAAAEVIDAVPFPPTDPTKPTREDELQQRREHEAAALAAAQYPEPDDDGFLADQATRGELKITAGQLTPEQATLAKNWERQGTAAGRSWNFTKDATRRTAAINGAALAMAVHLEGDDVLARCALEAALGAPLHPSWSIGGALGSFTHDQATFLRTYAERFGAGHGATELDLSNRFANHMAALEVAANQANDTQE